MGNPRPHHRLTAAESLGLAEIVCEIHYGSLLDAIWFSCSVNAAHGLRRTRDDVQLAIKRALAHPKSAGQSDRELADYIGCDHKTISAARQRMVVTGEIPQSQSRVDKNGVERVLPAKPQPAPEPAQLDIEDAISAGDDESGQVGQFGEGSPEPEKSSAAAQPAKRGIDQTGWDIAAHTANVLREQRKLPDARTAALSLTTLSLVASARGIDPGFRSGIDPRSRPCSTGAASFGQCFRLRDGHS